MYTNYRLRRRNNKIRRYLIFLGFLICIGTFTYGSLKFISSHFQNPQLQADSVKAATQQDANLARLINPILDIENGDYAIVVENLNNPGRRFLLNENQPIPAASLYKLFLLAASLRAIEEGKITENTSLSAKTEHLKEALGEEDFGYDSTAEEVSMNVGMAMDRIARVSDNYAAIMLAEKIGWNKVQEEANLSGAQGTKITNPVTTTAADIAEFLRRLYSRQIVSPESSDKLIALLKTSQINNRIPALLPEDIEVSHKTGELSRIRHDAGIVFLPNNPYIIVLMSNNLSGEDEAIDTLANISKTVFDYFKAQQAGN